MQMQGTVAPSDSLVIQPIGVQANLTIPQDPRGIVVFAHGSGSSRLSPRNLHVAAALQAAEIGTLLFDLLTPAEADDRGNVFDIDLLAGRLATATRWLKARLRGKSPPVAYFGASTGAAAALVAAARAGAEITSVVSRGGRPDLADRSLASVRAPTLLIVGEDDPDVLSLNREAMEKMTCEKKLVVVPGATHLFEEPGTLDVVIDLASRWFVDHFAARNGGT